MAKVKIQGHASGTGILTVTAPDTDVNRTITLPDADVTLGAATPSIDDNGNATAITIDSSENVGIGVTPETTHSTVRALQIGLGGRVWAHTSNASRAALSGNAYIDSSNVDKYINTDEATQYIQEDGLHKFQVAASGSADAAITWTTAMTIDNDGTITNGGGVYKIGTQTDATADGWNFESSGATMISCAQDTAVKIGNVRASGFIIINDTTVTGQAGVIVTGGGVISIVGQTASQFVSSSTPSTSQVGIYNAGGYVTIKNGKSSTIGMSLITFRTRTNQ